MRLSKEEVKAIKEVVSREDKAADIYLFGSRVHDDKKGGDIDLLIFSDVLSQKDTSKIKHTLWDIIGEQKIDIIIAKDDSHPFTKIALKEGVLL
jgi:predicted nucleotidyltransferase